MSSLNLLFIVKRALNCLVISAHDFESNEERFICTTPAVSEGLASLGASKEGLLDLLLLWLLASPIFDCIISSVFDLSEIIFQICEI